MYSFNFRCRIAYRPLHKPLPLITVGFSYNGASCTYPMLVDTGADNIVVPAAIADLLGLDLQTQCKSVCGRTFHYGVQEGYVSPTLSFSLPDVLPGRIFRCRACFSPWMDQQGYLFGLFGREILDQVRVCFTHEIEDAFYLDCISRA